MTCSHLKKFFNCVWSLTHMFADFCNVGTCWSDLQCARMSNWISLLPHPHYSSILLLILPISLSLLTAYDGTSGHSVSTVLSPTSIFIISTLLVIISTLLVKVLNGANWLKKAVELAILPDSRDTKHIFRLTSPYSTCVSGCWSSVG